jgi:hypothetical protein
MDLGDGESDFLSRLDPWMRDDGVFSPFFSDQRFFLVALIGLQYVGSYFFQMGSRVPAAI